MPTKKVTGGYVTVSKAGRVGTKVFTTKAGAEKVQRTARKNLANTRGGTAKAAPKKPGSKGNPAPAAATAAEPKKPERIGAVYSASKSAGALAAPVTDSLLIHAGTKPLPDVIRTDVAWKARPGARLPYLANAAVAAVDEVIDRKTAHKQALSGMSASAWLPEVYLASETYEGSKKGSTGRSSIAAAHRAAVITHQGYDPATGQSAFGDRRFRTYRALRHVGQLLRKARGKSGAVKRLTRPLARFAKMLGGRV